MQSATYQNRRDKLTEYFDRTAAAAWSRLTSDAPVGSVRATVRAGRDAMRSLLLDCLPGDLTGTRLLDAGCGTGALSIDAASRGASVVAVDVSGTLVELAASRTPAAVRERIDYRVGDMLATEHGEVDYVVAMDSMIHYETSDIVRMIASLAPRTRRGIVFTVAPRTAALTVMHAVGRMIPYQEHRAPAIVPVSEKHMRKALNEAPELDGWTLAHCEKVSSGFYKSQAFFIARHALG